MKTKVFEDELLIVEVERGRCIVTNKLRGKQARLLAIDDGFFELRMLPSAPASIQSSSTEFPSDCADRPVPPGPSSILATSRLG